MRRLLLTIAAACCVLAGKARADDRVAPGAFIIERPTLVSLGFEWKISGDDNRNAQVAVTYRRAGETAWHEALPLFRMGGEFIAGPKPQYGGRNYYDYSVPPAFAGSVLNLQPGTAYDVAATALDTVEQVSEVYSISGQYDLLIKCNLPSEMDVGRFVTSQIQMLSHVTDTQTIITFNAFT